MQSLLKFNLNGGLKRMVSTLICLMMVLATFPIHMLKGTVCAVGEVSIDLKLGETVQDGSEVKDWMTASTGDLDTTKVQNAGDINITLSTDITVTDAANKMDSSSNRFFDFTDKRFADKTITIDGVNHTIKIDNENLFFLNLKGCRVVLKNITIDGGWIKDGDSGIKRGGSFIYVSPPSEGSESELVIEEGTTIQNCKMSDSNSGSGICVSSNATLIMNGNAKISDCYAPGSYCYAGGIFVHNAGTLTMNDNASISDCYAAYGGGIYNAGTLTMNDNASISDCYAFTSGCGGGGICVCSGTLTMNDNATISNCYVLSDQCRGGGIYVQGGGTLTVNSGKIIACSASNGDAIYSYGNLYLHFREFGIFKIQLPSGHVSGACGHNTAPEAVMGYEGIYNDIDGGGTIQPISNYKIVFVDSESGSTVGSAFGNKPADSENIQETEKISIPDRPGYEFVKMSYTKDGAEQGITVTDGKFTLDDDMVGTAVCGVITVKVKYNKLYTVQYICDNKVVGTKSGCSEDMANLSGVVESTLSNITLDGETTLDSVVKPAAGYKFSNFTYGNGQTYTDGTTKWDDLKASAVDGVITVMLNYTGSSQGASASDTVKYVASGGHMILDKKSKLTNYSGVNLPIGGLRKVHEPKKVIFDFCGQTIHHNDPNVPFIQGVPGKHIVICNLNMDGGGCK